MTGFAGRCVAGLLSCSLLLDVSARAQNLQQLYNTSKSAAGSGCKKRYSDGPGGNYDHCIVNGQVIVLFPDGFTMVEGRLGVPKYSSPTLTRNTLMTQYGLEGKDLYVYRCFALNCLMPQRSYVGTLGRSGNLPSKSVKAHPVKPAEGATASSSMQSSVISDSVVKPKSYYSFDCGKQSTRELFSRCMQNIAP